ncbi:MAG TPA: hypothetical protein ENI42_06430 [Thermoplasmatales archaeon]|nr:hypothetical protein [Thermoplasmatales archaeon]
MEGVKLTTPIWIVLILVVAFVVVLALVFAGFFGTGDSDRDGIYDSEESQGYDIMVHYINGTKTVHVSSNPTKQDTDGDGLNDFEELFNTTNPADSDTDDDGLTDYEEITVYGTNPLYQDQDDDGLRDGVELKGWDVTVRGLTKHVTSNVSRADSDSDFFTDLQEYNAKTDPNLKDTDDDGVWDSADIDPLWNIRVTVDLVSFTSLKNGVAPYFVVYAYTNYTITPVVSVNYNETVPLDASYDLLNADIYDGTGGDTFTIRVSALDKNSQTAEGADAPLAINGSSSIWQINYNVTDSQKSFTVTGDDGILDVHVKILRE